MSSFTDQPLQWLPDVFGLDLKTYWSITFTNQWRQAGGKSNGE